MTQNEAYILASEVGGNAYNAGHHFWRVSKRLDKYTIRIYDSPSYYWEQYG